MWELFLAAVQQELKSWANSRDNFVCSRMLWDFMQVAGFGQFKPTPLIYPLSVGGNRQYNSLHFPSCLGKGKSQLVHVICYLFVCIMSVRSGFQLQAWLNSHEGNSKITTYFSAPSPNSSADNEGREREIGGNRVVKMISF